MEKTLSTNVKYVMEIYPTDGESPSSSPLPSAISQIVSGVSSKAKDLQDFF